MHIETFLYMLLQSNTTLPPPGVQPDFEALAQHSRAQSTPNRWLRIPSRTVTVGLDERTGYWGWDNEKPVRTFEVTAFEAKARPLTNGDYAKYLVESGSGTSPKSWMVEPKADTQLIDESQEQLINGYSTSVDSAFLEGKAVRTVYGPVPLILALDWPVVGSYDELAGCAEWLGGRIPTMEEAKAIYAEAEEMKAPMKTSPGIAPQKTTPKEPHLSDSLHADLRGCNVSFQTFHPMPVTLQQDELAGMSGMGGVWEWTSTMLTKWDGFESMMEYPAYTSEYFLLSRSHQDDLRSTDDFFDNKHNVVLGGSWATHSKIAGRKSL